MIRPFEWTLNFSWRVQTNKINERKKILFFVLYVYIGGIY